MTPQSKVQQADLKPYFQTAFSIDIALISFVEGRVKILTIEKDSPYDQSGLGLGLPGRIISPAEDADKALDTYMDELIGTHRFRKKQLKALTDPGRHPLGRIITVAYYGLIAADKVKAPAGKKLYWQDLFDLPELAYDHAHIVKTAIGRFKKGLLRHPNVFELLPKKFILSEVVAIYEQAFDRPIDGPNLRRQLKESGLLYTDGEERKALKQMGRPPLLYSFDKKKFKGQRREIVGFNF